jgi:hypothetical protein
MKRVTAVAFIGTELANNMFQFHDTGADGQAVLTHGIRRERLLAEIAELEEIPNGRGPKPGDPTFTASYVRPNWRYTGKFAPAVLP